MKYFASVLCMASVASATKVVCIGASITEKGDWNTGTPSYCGMLPNYLGEGYEVVNLGLSGRTMFKDGKENDGSETSYW